MSAANKRTVCWPLRRYAPARSFRPAKSGLLVLRVIVDRHGQEAQLTGEGLDHRGRQPASVAKEVALPTQGAELHGEAELIDHAAANGDLLQVPFGQGEVLAQAFRIEGFWQLLSRLQTRGTAV